MFSKNVFSNNMSSMKNKLADSLNIPEDLAKGAAIVTVTGNRLAYVENYRGIIEYSKECIRLQTKTCRIRITGCELDITYYTNDDMKITGEIHQIQYEVTACS